MMVTVGFASICSNITEQTLRAVCEKVAADPTSFLAAVVAALVVAVVRPVRVWGWGIIKSIYFRLATAWSAGSRLKRARDSVAPDGRGPWLAITRRRASDYDLRMAGAIDSTPVLMCANEKGGVGKTTTTCNLAARFAAIKSKPVLVIDLDFQGSCSSMVFAGTKWQPSPGQESAASLAICGGQSEGWLTTVAESATWKRNPDSKNSVIVQVPNLKGIAAFHDLAEAEDRVRLLWAIEEERRDIRYFLYELLHNDILRDKFSMVFIDGPPRLSTACVQALAASNYLLVPTVLDELSADAVGYFGKQLKRHEELWPRLKVLGIIGTLVEGHAYERPALTSAGDALRRSLRGSEGKLYAIEASGRSFEFPYKLAVPKLAALGRSAGKGIAYATLGDNDEGRRVRDVFNRLAEEIVQRMQL